MNSENPRPQGKSARRVRRLRRRNRSDQREANSASNRLRVVGRIPPVSTPAEPTVRLQLGEVFPLLLHAYRQNHAWLTDMADDPIAVTSDLAEILAAFREAFESHKPA